VKKDKEIEPLQILAAFEAMRWSLTDEDQDKIARAIGRLST
jgi:hypothetical protein